MIFCLFQSALVKIDYSSGAQSRKRYVLSLNAISFFTSSRDEVPSNIFNWCHCYQLLYLFFISSCNPVGLHGLILNIMCTERFIKIFFTIKAPVPWIFNREENRTHEKKYYLQLIYNLPSRNWNRTNETFIVSGTRGIWTSDLSECIHYNVYAIPERSTMLSYSVPNIPSKRFELFSPSLIVLRRLIFPKRY